MLVWALCVLQPTMSYDRAMFTLPVMTDSAPLLNHAALALVGSPFIMTTFPRFALSPMAFRSASPWSLPTCAPSKLT